MENLILYTILLPTIIVSIMAFKDFELMDKFKFNPAHIQNSKEWYRFFSYGFVHSDYMHLGINMWVFWIFGQGIIWHFNYFFEDLANLYFLALYIPALAISVIPSYLKHRNNVFYNAVGASGAVSAVVYASIILAPTSSLYLFLIPFPIPAWLFGILYLVYTVIMDKRGNSNIGHSAHLWGALFGLFFMLIAKPDVYIYFFQQIFS